MLTRARMCDHRQIPGTIPLVYPNGASRGLSDGIALRPAVAAGVSLNAVPALQTAAAVSPMNPALAATAPLHPLQATALGVAPAGVPFAAMSSAVPGKYSLHADVKVSVHRLILEPT